MKQNVPVCNLSLCSTLNPQTKETAQEVSKRTQSTRMLPFHVRKVFLTIFCSVQLRFRLLNVRQLFRSTCYDLGTVGYTDLLWYAQIDDAINFVVDLFSLCSRQPAYSPSKDPEINVCDKNRAWPAKLSWQTSVLFSQGRTRGLGTGNPTCTSSPSKSPTALLPPRKSDSHPLS